MPKLLNGVHATRCRRANDFPAETESPPRWWSNPSPRIFPFVSPVSPFLPNRIDSTRIVHNRPNNALGMTTPATERPGPMVRTVPENQRWRPQLTRRDLLHALFLGGNALGFVLVQLEVPDAYLVSDDTGFNISTRYIFHCDPSALRLRCTQYRIIARFPLRGARLDPSRLLIQTFWAISIVWLLHAVTLAYLAG